VQKHAKQLKCDVNSQQFKDIMRYLWMPRLVERIQADASTSSAKMDPHASLTQMDSASHDFDQMSQNLNPSPEISTTTGSSSDSVGVQLWSPPISNSCFTDSCAGQTTVEHNYGYGTQEAQFTESWSDSFTSICGYNDIGLPDFDMASLGDNFWNVEDIWLCQ
jgi:transcription factor MYB, plant